MNPLFTLGEEFRLHDSSRFRKKAGDAKFRFYHSFVPVLMCLAAESCRSRAESVHLLEPYLQWGKGWKSSNFVTPDDSARNRKMRKMMSLNCSICLMPTACNYLCWKSLESNEYNFVRVKAIAHRTTITSIRWLLTVYGTCHWRWQEQVSKCGKTCTTQ